MKTFMYFLVSLFYVAVSLTLYITHGEINNSVAYAIAIITMILCTGLGAASLIAGMVSLTSKK